MGDSLQSCMTELAEYNVRNSGELVPGFAFTVRAVFHQPKFLRTPATRPHAKARVLEKHLVTFEKELPEIAEKGALALSAVTDADQLNAFVDARKPVLKVIQDDIRDAKRRISLAKGPKPKKAKDLGEGGSGGSGSEDICLSD